MGASQGAVPVLDTQNDTSLVAPGTMYDRKVGGTILTGVSDGSKRRSRGWPWLAGIGSGGSSDGGSRRKRFRLFSVIRRVLKRRHHVQERPHVDMELTLRE